MKKKENNESSEGSKSKLREMSSGNLKTFKSKPLSLLDEVSLNPFEKYQQYNIFPWEFLFHLLVIIFSSAQMLIAVNNIGMYERAQEKVWYEMFQDNVQENNEFGFNGIKNFYEIDTLQEHIVHKLDDFFNLDESKYNHVYIFDNETQQDIIKPVLFEYYFLRNEDRKQYEDMTKNITQDDYSIWNSSNSDIKEFINKTTNFKLTYEIEHDLPTSRMVIVDWWRWVITQDFDFYYRNHITERFKFQRYSCNSEKNTTDFWTSYAWLQLIVILVCIGSWVLQIKYIAKVSIKYTIMKLRYMKTDEVKVHHSQRLIQTQINDRKSDSSSNDGEGEKSNEGNAEGERKSTLSSIDAGDIPNWEDLSLNDKMKLFNAWGVLIIIGNIAQIIGSFFMFITGGAVFRQAELLIGIGWALSWLALPKTYENVSCYNIMNNTIFNSSSVLTRSLIGAAPVFIGMAFFSMWIFLQSPRFGDLTTSFQTLFALMYTESVYDIFLNIYKLRWLMSQLFVYIYLFVAIGFIQNIFLIIIGDGYVKSKYIHNGFIPQDNNVEDPLEVFEDDNEDNKKSTDTLVRMLRYDKHMLLKEYYESRGIEYNSEFETDQQNQPKSLEKLSRLINKQIDKTLGLYTNSVSDVKNNEAFIDDEYDKASKAASALQYKLDQLKKELDSD